MITKQNVKKILCYGDSNTWGRTPDRKARYASNVRWPGKLQDLLGAEYDVIEEGLGGRTINLDHPKKEGRNGESYLSTCLESHSPLDAVIIMLGTNDLKSCFNSTPESIASALSGLIDHVFEKAYTNSNNHPEVLIISPVIIEPDAPRFMEFYSGDYAVSSGEMSKRLAPVIKDMCEQRGVKFLDGAEFAKVGEDGLHLGKGSNLSLAKAIKSVFV